MKNNPSNLQAEHGRNVLKIPTFLKPLLKRIYFFMMDIKHYVKYRKDDLIPPPHFTLIDSESYEKIGKEFFGYFKKYADIQPHFQILDVGCGTGRLSIPLTSFLSEEGSYTGFDVISEEVEWATENISSKFSNFKYVHVDVTNNIYHKGGVGASEFVFPFENQKFDFVFLNSVFTHMLPRDLENYLSEISRVLKPEGKCFISFFLLNEHSKISVAEGTSLIKFDYDKGEYLTNDNDSPEEAIAYEEEYIKSLFELNDLIIVPPILYGSWSLKDNPLSFQDFILAKRK